MNILIFLHDIIALKHSGNTFSISQNILEW